MTCITLSLLGLTAHSGKVR